ncbi:hypothetical protein EMCRGX_G020072 [Ephydatia muelleri]
MFLSALVLSVALGEFIGSFKMVEDRTVSILVSQVVRAVVWAIHTVCVYQLSRSVKHSGRGPLLLNFIWYLTLVGIILRVRSVVRSSSYPGAYTPETTPYFEELIRISVYAQLGIQALYAATLLFSADPVTGDNVQLAAELTGRLQASSACEGTGQHLLRTETLQESEREPLLRGHLQEEEEDVEAGTARFMQHQGGHQFRPHLQQVLQVSQDNASIFSKLVFWWVNPLMHRGALGMLEKPSHLPPLPAHLTTSYITRQFARAHATGSSWWQTLRSKCFCLESLAGDGSAGSIDPEEHTQRIVKNVSLLGVFNRAFGYHYYPLGVLKLTSDSLGFAGPLLLNALINFMENKNEPMFHGYLYALGLFSSTLVASMLITHFNNEVNMVGLKLRAALISEVYRKSLSVNLATLSHFSTGQVVNFMSTDTDRIVNFCQSFHQFWSLPIQIAVSLYLLYQQVGLAFLTGLVFCLLLIPINRWLAIKIGSLSTQMMAQKDKRVKLISEIIRGIRVIKFYAWERHFYNQIKGLRAAELRSLKWRKYLDAMCVYFWATTPVLISVLTFATYVLMGQELTAAKVFTSVALFNVLISPLNAFPWVINGLMEARVSVKRVQAYLNLPELDLSHYFVTNGMDQFGSEAVGVRNGSFCWRIQDCQEDGDVTEQSDAGPMEWSLVDINISFNPGKLVGVVGKVGSGKSSLLAALTGEMWKKKGEVFLSCLSQGVGLCTQEAWIQHATLKDNILFGKPFDADKYVAVILACALEKDLQTLPAGDLTEVGENGVTLSGGQKARVALARAVYQDKDVYFLDDPLAAVDAHVANHLFSQCIMGLLRTKTRVLCTHHVRFLYEADLIVVMDDGQIILSGPPSEILPQIQDKLVREGRMLRELDRESTPMLDEEPKRKVLYHKCVHATCDFFVQDIEPLGANIESNNEGVLVMEEEKEVGVVSASVYKAYYIAVGYIMAPAILLSLFLMQGSKNTSDLWLAYWVSQPNGGNSSSTNSTLNIWLYSTERENSLISGSTSYSAEDLQQQSVSDKLQFYLSIYGALAFANSVFTLFRAFVFAYGGIHAAVVLHRRLLSSILKAPVVFFDVTPIGRIINRFSSDVYAIDDSLPFILNILLAQVYSLLGTLVVTCYGLPYVAILIVPLGMLYYQIQAYYRVTSRELKRLSTVTLSPIYAHFSETLAGRLEINQRANYSSYVVSQWLGIRLQMLGVIMVTCVSFIAVLEHHFGSINPGMVGLAISYSLSVTTLLSGAVTSFTETEKQMVSVERVEQYINGTPSEIIEGSTETCLPTDWPSDGKVEFREAVLTYRKGLPPALQSTSFVIEGGEKIGVVGRTGAGKSSLFQALFRMVQLTSGTILIDGADISSVPLDRLRSSLTIIPQDPFLFSGTIQENLDPCNEHSEAELWSVLERCHLKTIVEQMGGLFGEVTEKGSTFSLGQRQLLCLARALLMHAKIICIDEGTSSVDVQTDRQIQETIKAEFKSSTVITIAHRIETILNSDKILVMGNGEVKEYGSPSELQHNPHSLFTLLCEEHARQ